MPAEAPKPARVAPYRMALGMERPKKFGRCVVLNSCQSFSLNATPSVATKARNVVLRAIRRNIGFVGGLRAVVS